MRLGLHILPDRPLAEQALAAESHGFDLLWLDDNPGSSAGTALLAASLVAGATDTIRVVAVVRCGPHPVSLAEEAAVADLTLGGRLSVALRRGVDDAELDETVTLLRAAWTARPFRHEGQRWTVPANLPANTGWLERRLRVTPTPAQIQLPVWLVGTETAPVAVEHCLPVVGDAEGPDQLALTWGRIEERLGRASLHLPRPAIVNVPRVERADVESISAELIAARELYGLDVAVLRLPTGLDDAQWSAALATIAHEIRPRVQMDALPPGTEAFWTEQRTHQIEEEAT
ncbi:MAG: LLM class flavin-dependent oxidoreductase [Microthrixaceae bacterium]